MDKNILHGVVLVSLMYGTLVPAVAAPPSMPLTPKTVAGSSRSGSAPRAVTDPGFTAFRQVVYGSYSSRRDAESGELRAPGPGDSFGGSYRRLSTVTSDVEPLSLDREGSLGRDRAGNR